LAISYYSVLMQYSLPLAVDDVARATQLHIGGMWVTFVVSALLLAWLIGRMTEALRSRDAQLAAVREQALRNAQVVMLGQQAAGAAHALGSPLATMTILAGELAQDQRLPADVHADAALLLEQLAQCKRCIGQMVQQAGVTRAGESDVMTVQAWLSGILERWHSVWPRASCRLECVDQAKSLRVTLDIQVEQALTNLLDNAVRMSPAAVRVTAECQPESLCIAVCDSGPGFSAAVMENAGRAPQLASAQGNGMGLWLTRSMLESLGGSLQLENTASGGRAVLLLPLEKVCTE
jgi:two-component system sensor histidine kinase RegB